MNNLCIDIGNTRVKYLVIDNKKHHDIIRSKKLKKSIVNSLVKKYDIDSIAISSVVKDNPAKGYIWPKSCKIIILDYKTKIPIENKYKTPKTLGKDRLASVIGANGIFRDRNVLVIDYGTCIKLDFISAKGEYLGGNISPGVDMRIRAMHEFTSQLPMVKMEYNPSILGDSTETALQNGAVRGTIFEIESFIRSMEKNYKDLKIIFTGGNADFFASYTNYKIFVHQNLVLQGLNKIIEHNEH